MVPKPSHGLEHESPKPRNFVHKNFETAAELTKAFPSISYLDPISFTPSDLHGNLLAGAYDQAQKAAKELGKASLNILYGTHRAGKTSIFHSLLDMFPQNEGLLLDCAGGISESDFDGFRSRFEHDQARLGQGKMSLLLVDEIQMIKDPQERKKILELLTKQGCCAFITVLFPREDIVGEITRFAKQAGIISNRINIVSDEADWIMEGRVNHWLKRLFNENGISVVAGNDFLSHLGGLTGFKVYEVGVILTDLFNWIKANPEKIKKGDLFDVVLDDQIFEEFLKSSLVESISKTNNFWFENRFIQYLTIEELSLIQRIAQDGQIPASDENLKYLGRIFSSAGVDFLRVDKEQIKIRGKLFSDYIRTHYPIKKE